MEALKHKDQAGMKLLKRTQYQDQDGMFKGWYWSNTGQVNKLDKWAQVPRLSTETSRVLLADDYWTVPNQGQTKYQRICFYVAKLITKVLVNSGAPWRRFDGSQKP
jgi:hypothetical protein